jgi:hypothetical protein
MSKRNLKIVKEVKIERPEPAKLSAEESIKRTKEFNQRKEKFVATVRQSKN